MLLSCQSRLSWGDSEDDDTQRSQKEEIRMISYKLSRKRIGQALGLLALGGRIKAL